MKGLSYVQAHRLFMPRPCLAGFSRLTSALSTRRVDVWALSSAFGLEGLVQRITSAIRVERHLQGLAETESVLASRVKVEDWVHREKWALLGTGLLVAVLYAPSFRQLVSDWWSDENYSHGFAVPIVGAWLLWQRRNQIASTNLAPRPLGMAIIAFAAAQLAIGTLGAEHFVAATSFLIMMCGIILYLCGSKVLRLAAFPIAWLLFMIPLPAVLFYSITFPLQLMASQGASRLLDLLSVPNLCDGNVIYLANFEMGVAEACSGIRSLISLLAFAVLLGQLLQISTAGRLVLAISTLPIALGVNAARIVLAGLIGNYVGRQWAEGFSHAFAGWLLFFGAVTLTLGVAQILRRFSRTGTMGVSTA